MVGTLNGEKETVTKVTILTCYVRGTHEMMHACLDSIRRHTKCLANVIIGSQEGNLDDGLFDAVTVMKDEMAISVVEVPNRYIKKGHEHGCIVDRVIETEVSTEYVLTLDSDSIPMKDGWLQHLLDILENDEEVCTAGILHPWSPPPPEMKKSKLEYRVRSQHCYETTHVACQLIRMKDIKELKRKGIGYASGDDTGLGMVQSMRNDGRKCAGYKPSRCPNPAVPEFDAEFNRYSCVVYGDAVIHVGGHTRVTVDGDDPVFDRAFGWAADRILEDGSADFLLDDENSYQYKFDKEEEVSEEKMQRLFGLRDQRMKVL
jgi:hypothetical protein